MTISPAVSTENQPYATVRKPANVKVSFYLFKPKFHYADLSRTQITKVCDTNHDTDFHDLCPRQSPRTLLPTFPMHCNELNSITVTQTGLLQTLSQTPRHVEMVYVRDFRDLCQRLSPKLHDFMICHRSCPRLS